MLKIIQFENYSRLFRLFKIIVGVSFYAVMVAILLALNSIIGYYNKTLNARHDRLGHVAAMIEK